MTYPKPVTAELVAAARERLLTAKTDPDQQVYAGNMAWHIEQHASDQEGRTKDERVANWNDDAGCAGPPSETTRSRAEMPANFDDCEGIWHAIEMTCAAGGNSEGFKDRDGADWLILG